MKSFVVALIALTTATSMATVAAPAQAVSTRAEASADAASVSPHGAESYERADLVSARTAAVDLDREVLATAETTETSLVYARPDGSLRTEVSVAPVRLKQSDGSWADVDYDLTALPGGGFAPKVSPAKVVFSGGGGGAAVTLDQGSRGLDLSWAKTLPAPTVQGPTARYDLGGGRTLVLSATSDGFEQSLELAAPPVTAPKMRLGFDTTGLELVGNEFGGFDFVKTGADGSASSSVVFTMPAPVMYSSEVVEEEHTQVARVAATLSTDDDSEPALDLSAGMAFLTDPTTVYPVTIDPVISSVTRAGDTYVTAADALQHVSDPDLRIGLSSAGNLRRSLVRFDAASSIPSGAHITNAALDLWNNGTPTCSARSVYAYPLTQSVVLSNATWANQPTYTTSTAYRGSGSFAHGNESLGCANDTGSINVTKMVQAWVSGDLPEYGMALVGGSETDSTYAKTFCSMNLDPTPATSCTTTSNFPTLSVTYNSLPAMNGDFEVDPSVAGTDSRITSSDTPLLSVGVTDADGDALDVKFAVYPMDGTVAVAEGTVSGVLSGRTARWVVPERKLVMGRTYRWQASVTDGTDSSGWGPAQTVRLSEPAYVTAADGLSADQVQSVVSDLGQPILSVQATVATAADGTELTVGVNSEDGVLDTDLMAEVSATLDDMAEDAASAPVVTSSAGTGDLASAASDVQAAGSSTTATLSLLSTATAAVAADTVKFDKIVVADMPPVVPAGVTATQDATHAVVAAAIEPAVSDCPGTYKPNLMESRIATSQVKNQRRAVLQFWFTQSRLDELVCKDGGRTTFEPDLTTYNYDDKHYFDKKIKAWGTSMPNGYKDTAFADGGDERTYTIGTSRASKLKKNTWYTTYFRAKKGNSSTDKGKVYSQRGRRKITTCDSTWCIFGRDSQKSILPWEAALPGTTTRGEQPPR